MMQRIEAIPNISDGRRPELLHAAVEAIQSVKHVSVLDYSADPSHNRSVITIVGPSKPLLTAILRLYEIAIPSIDLRQHQGEHPRIGAVDVVPFIPLANSSIKECIELAKTVGKEVAKHFNIPIYLYGQAASLKNRFALEQVRQGQFEGLKARMNHAGETPDYGPTLPHQTAGASAIGVRTTLIAFNVNLNTDNLKIASQIAINIRERDGGLPHVKALGIKLEHLGIVQVSINLTDYTRTSLHTVFALVLKEAKRHGVTVIESELVGLMPTAALSGKQASTLKLKTFTEEQLLETKLRRLASS